MHTNLEITKLITQSKVNLLQYINDYPQNITVKSVLQYILDPYTPSYGTVEMAEPLDITRNNIKNISEYNSSQDKALSTVLSQLRMFSTDSVVRLIKLCSSEMGKDYQELLQKILSKEIELNVTNAEIGEVYPDVNKYQVPIHQDCNDKMKYPLIAHQLPDATKRVICVSCLSNIKFFDISGQCLSYPKLSKTMLRIASDIPIAFDGFMFQDYYILCDMMPFGDFKRGRCTYPYKKRHERLVKDINDYRESVPSANFNVKLPVFIHANNDTEFVKFCDANKNNTVIAIEYDNTYNKKGMYWIPTVENNIRKTGRPKGKKRNVKHPNI